MSQYNSHEPNQLFLICGDFNIAAGEFPNDMKEMILKMKPDYGFLFDLFEAEYE